MKLSLARGAIWLAVTRSAINVIGLFSTLLLARLLVPEDFGLVAIAATVLAIIGSITEISLSSALIQHREPTDDHYDTAFTLGAIRSLLVTLATAALAWPIAEFYGDDRLIALIIVLAAASSLSGLINPRLVLFTRALVFRQEFVLGVSNKLIGFVAAAITAMVWQSYWALVVGSFTSQVVNLVLSYILVRYRPRFCLIKSRELLSFSVWLTLSQALSTLNYRLDTLFIGYFLGKSLLGYYSFGDNLANLVTREATSPVANTLFPGFVRIAEDRDRLRAAYFKAQGMLFAIALPVGVGFSVIAEPLILLSVGEKWRGAIIVVQVVAAASGLGSISASYMSLALALGTTQIVFHRELISLVIRAPILILGLWFGGFFGLLVARIATGLIGIYLNMNIIKVLIDVEIRTQFMANRRPMMSTSIIVIIGYAFGYIHVDTSLSQALQLLILAGQIMISGVAYIMAMWFFWAISGRPEGVERECAAILKRAIDKYYCR